MSDRQRASEFVGKQDLTAEEVHQICDYIDGNERFLVFRPIINNEMPHGIITESQSERP